MSDCNACYIATEADGICDIFERRQIAKSRKAHKCCECHREIPIGSAYESTFTLFEGDAMRQATCAICVEIRDTYLCKESDCPVIGNLWDDITESGLFEALTEGCIWKLKTGETMEYIRQRANKWREAHELPTI